VGAATETELEDRKLRIEDAKNATFAAVEEGIVPGGGAALLHLAELVPEFSASLSDSEERLGADLVGKARAYSPLPCAPTPPAPLPMYLTSCPDSAERLAARLMGGAARPRPAPPRAEQAGVGACLNGRWLCCVG